MRSFLRLASHLALASTLGAGLAACADDAAPADPAAGTDVTDHPSEPQPPAPPSGVPDPLAAVTVHTSADVVRFTTASGALALAARPVDGVVRAAVPVGSAVTAVGPEGAITIGGLTKPVRTFETVTSLADGDEVYVRGGATPADRPDVALTLPAAPAGTTEVRVYWCSRSAVATAATLTLDRSRCGDRKGALVVASDTEPRAAIRVDDVGDAGALDLSAAAWQPIEPVMVTLSPAPPADAYSIFVHGSALLDGDVIQLGTGHAVGGATYAVPSFAGGAVTVATATRANGVSTTDQITTPIASTADLVVDPIAPFPALEPHLVGPRTFRIDGDVDAARASLVAVAHADGNAVETWTVHLRGTDRGFTLPGDGPDLVALTLSLRTDRDGARITRRLFTSAP